MVGVGVLVGGVVADGHNVRSVVSIEFMTGTAWSVGIVINGHDEVVNTVVVEEGIKNDVIPSTGEVEIACIDGLELAERYKAVIFEVVYVSVGEVDGAIFLVEVGGVLVVETDGGDGLLAIKFRG